MSLYLCVFASEESDDELEGVEVGSYDDFHKFRFTVANQLEGGRWGSRYPILMSHVDNDGTWLPEVLAKLRVELDDIAREMKSLGPASFPADSWQASVFKAIGTTPRSLAESFIDIDGEPLLERLIALIDTAVEAGRPIHLQ